ncbi:MAG: energy transducer TonB [Candidatus Omnitrophota bacterium]|jgi:outer membrane biosynthesis protein TonB
MTDRIFQITFLISFFAHSVVLFANSGLQFHSRDRREVPVEITYVRNKAPEYKETVLSKKEERLRMSAARISVKNMPPPFISKEDMLKNNSTMLSRKADFVKPTVPKPDITAVKKKINLPPVDLNKIDNPSYLGYYQIVREKIRRSAYQSYTKTETGEVYLTFLIARNGSLVDVRLNSERSSPSVYLKEVASHSIRVASPFPLFPKELDYPQLSFNVIISFEIE